MPGVLQHQGQPPSPTRSICVRASVEADLTAGRRASRRPLSVDPEDLDRKEQEGQAKRGQENSGAREAGPGAGRKPLPSCQISLGLFCRQRETLVNFKEESDQKAASGKAI